MISRRNFIGLAALLPLMNFSDIAWSEDDSVEELLQKLYEGACKHDKQCIRALEQALIIRLNNPVPVPPLLTSGEFVIYQNIPKKELCKYRFHASNVAFKVERVQHFYVSHINDVLKRIDERADKMIELSQYYYNTLYHNFEVEIKTNEPNVCEFIIRLVGT